MFEGDRIQLVKVPRTHFELYMRLVISLYFQLQMIAAKLFILLFFCLHFCVKILLVFDLVLQTYDVH